MIVAIGTEKGAWFYDPNTGQLDGPTMPGWKVTAFTDTVDGTYLLATGSNWFGASIHRSADLAKWSQLTDAPRWPDGGERKLSQIWTFTRSDEVLFAGVDEAGLFRSSNSGTTWEPVDGLNEHPTRPGWHPGFGGLALHKVLVDPTDPNRIWVGISAVGAFRSEDGGESWEPVNDGVAKTAPSKDFDDIGFCIHGLALDPDHPDLLYRQDHQGVYRSSDGANTWERAETGLPGTFGFPMVMDHSSKALYVVPLQSDEFRLPPDGRFRVYRSTDGADTWHESGLGHPEAPTYTAALRGAMDTDHDGGVYYGTTSGTFRLTSDGGDTWTTPPWTLPRILSVKVLPSP